MFSSLFMDQINIQFFCQVESELFHEVLFDLRKVFRKLMPIGAHQFPTLNASEEISVDAAARVSTKNWSQKAYRQSEYLTPNYPGSNERAFSLKFERDLYAWQIIAIKNVLAGQKDTIVIAGTGSRKSFKVSYHISDSVISLSSSDNDSEGWGNSNDLKTRLGDCYGRRFEGGVRKCSSKFVTWNDTI